MNQKNFFTENNQLFWGFKSQPTAFDSINSNNFPAAFFSVIGVMVEDCNYHIKDCYNQDRRLFFKGLDSELLLRYGFSELIVARIQFAHTRRGNMTKLFEVLKHIKHSYHLEKIVIEAVQTDAMRSWCVKNGFKPCGDPTRAIDWEWT